MNPIRFGRVDFFPDKVIVVNNDDRGIYPQGFTNVRINRFELDETGERTTLKSAFEKAVNSENPDYLDIVKCADRAHRMLRGGIFDMQRVREQTQFADRITLDNVNINVASAKEIAGTIASPEPLAWENALSNLDERVILITPKTNPFA